MYSHLSHDMRIARGFVGAPLGERTLLTQFGHPRPVHANDLGVAAAQHVTNAAMNHQVRITADR